MPSRFAAGLIFVATDYVFDAMQFMLNIRSVTKTTSISLRSKATCFVKLFKYQRLYKLPHILLYNYKLPSSAVYQNDPQHLSHCPF